MVRFWVVVLGVVLSVSASALDLGPSLKQAVRLELAGRLGEALEAYRDALGSDSTLIHDETVSQDATVFALSHAGHLAADLGYDEEAQSYAARLAASQTPNARWEGLLLSMRISRLQGQPQKALDAYEAFSGTRPVNGALAAELARSADLAGKPRSADRVAGPETWWLEGRADLVPSAADSFGLQIATAVRLPLGAFRDWDNALTLIDMLREKGWSPLTDVKRSSEKGTLYEVSVLSRQPETDRQRLRDQGLLP